MIVNLPRSEAELSPLLRSISVHAADQFEDPEDVRPVVPAWIPRRLGIPSILILVAIAAHFAIESWSSRITSPSSFSLKADQFRATARHFEAEAGQYRAIAATGKPGTFPGVGNPISPRVALRLARTADGNAARFRKQAYLEERKNLGLPVP